MSDGEAAFLHFWHILLPDMPTPEREYRFDPWRAWRFDFAWPAVSIAVEVESWGHRTEARYMTDMEKYNEATQAGWQVYRCTRKMLETSPDRFLQIVEQSIRQREASARKRFLMTAEEGE